MVTVPRVGPSAALARRARRALAYAAELAMPVPRTLRFLVDEHSRARSEPLYPAVGISPGLAVQAALDEWLLAAMKTPGRYPRRDGYVRTGQEVAAAEAVLRERGWLDDPSSFHPPPPRPLDASVAVRSWPVRYEQLTFTSGWEPDPALPGRDRWMSYAPNRRAHAWVLRADPAAPWLVCLHAFGMGMAHLDLWAFRASWLHHDVGLNVVMPVLPLHGPRRVGTLSGSAFMGYNVVDVGHGIAQSIWDVRRTLRWVREQGGRRVGVYGVSLGAHVASILAGLEDDLRCVVAGVPTTDFTELFALHTPVRVRERALEHGLLGTVASRVHSVATPLAFPPLVPRDRLFVYASVGDRMATPAHAYALWRHWGEPEITWLSGNHVAFLWSRDVLRFVERALRASLVDAPAGSSS